MSYLVTGVHEQSYVAHVMEYSACVGDHAGQPDCLGRAASAAGTRGAPSSSATRALFLFLPTLLPFLLAPQ